MSSDKVLILVGGGHAHVQVVCDFPKVKQKKDSLRCVLISDDPLSLYSGMLPAVVAGLCQEELAQVNLPLLCSTNGWSFIHARVTRVDTATNTVFFSPATATGYVDVECPMRFSALSINVGSATRTIPSLERSNSQTASASHSTLAPCAIIQTRPISKLAPALTSFETAWSSSNYVAPKINVLVVGAGAAGLELALALDARFSRTLKHANVKVVSRSASYASEHGNSPGAAVLAEARQRNIGVILGRRVIALDETTGYATLDDGSHRVFHLAVIATGAVPHPSLAKFGLPLDSDGWLHVEPTLRCVDTDNVFAVGDCASFGGKYGKRLPPKAGVYAVRQGPFLTHNLQVTLQLDGIEPNSLRAFVPQTSFLSLLSLGNGRGIGSKYGIVFKGTWVFRLKMYIDEGWQQRFRLTRENSSNVEMSKEHVDIDAHSVFEGTPEQGAAALVGVEGLEVGDSFDTQLLVLKRMDEEEQFRTALLRLLSDKS